MKNILRAILFSLGVCLSVSESPWFPYLNFVGVLFFFMCALVQDKPYKIRANRRF